MSDEDGDIKGEESSGEEDSGAEESSSKKGGKKKLILIIVVAVVVLVGGGGAGAYFMGFLDSLLGIAHEEEVVAEIPPGPPVYYEMPQLVVDLKKTGNRTNYLKVKIVIEIVTRDKPLLEGDEIKITDKVQSWLRSQTRKELAGGTGTENMRAEVTKIANEILAPAKVESVLFREILLQ